MYLTDTDLYKFTMMQAVYHQFPGVEVEYEFMCRNNIRFSPEDYKKIYDRIMFEFCGNTFKSEELSFLSNLRFMKKDFIDFLRLYHPDKRHVKISYDSVSEKIDIKVKGPWVLTIPFEVPILSIISEVYNERVGLTDKELTMEASRIAMEALEFGFSFSDFGTRRRFSKLFHEMVIAKITRMRPIATSNVRLAMIHNLTPIGTMAHEWIMAGAGVGKTPLVDSQKYMLQKWVEEYRGDLGIALTDTYGIDPFLRDFDLYFAKLYDGVRHDSGDPISWGYKMLDHYDWLKIPAHSKTLIFSDGLSFQSAAKIHEEFRLLTNVSFGIGTNLVNPEIDGWKRPQIVMKLTSVNGKPVAKLSDTPGKEMCKDKEFLRYVNKVFRGV